MNLKWFVQMYKNCFDYKRGHKIFKVYIARVTVHEISF